MFLLGPRPSHRRFGRLVWTVDDQADSGWNLTIGANQAQIIQWLSSSKDLIVGTDIGEWVINDDDINSPIPTIKEQSRWGSSAFQGELMTESLFFVPKDKRGLIHSLYSFQIDGYQSEDVSIVATDLLESGITSQSIMKDPDPIWWGTTGDGKMIGFLFNRTQEIQGWHWHDIQGGQFKQVVCYYNPVKSQEGIFACIRSVPPVASSLDNAEYYLAYMDFDHPCIDFPQYGKTTYNPTVSDAGFGGSWEVFQTRSVAGFNGEPFDYYLANSFCWEGNMAGELSPYPKYSPKIDIITTAPPTSSKYGIPTGFCWTTAYALEGPYYYQVSDRMIGGGRLGFYPVFEMGNDALINYSTTPTSTFSNVIWGLHIESEFISLPMGNTSNYIIPAMTTKISQLRYQVLRDASDDVAPNIPMTGDAGKAYGYPRIQAVIEALDYSAPLGANKNDTQELSVYLNNGRGHEVLSGPSSTDTRLRFALTDAKKTDILSAYIIYDSDLV